MITENDRLATPSLTRKEREGQNKSCTEGNDRNEHGIWETQDSKHRIPVLTQQKDATAKRRGNHVLAATRDRETFREKTTGRSITG